MNFKRRKLKNAYLGDTQVENIFLAEYMPDAEGLFVKVYLLALMYADEDGISNKDLAAYLNVNEEEVLRAWSYWESCGIIKKRYNRVDDKLDYAVEFLNLKEQIFGLKGISEAAIAGAQQLGDAVIGNSSPVENSQSLRSGSAASGSVMSGNQSLGGSGDTSFSISMNDTVLKDTFSEIEDVTKRALEGREAESIVSWICSEGVAPEYVIYVYRYCVERCGKNSFNYVARVLDEWQRKGIKTCAQAEQYLDETDLRRSQYRRIMQALGFNRNATEKEKSLIDSWFDEMGFGIDKILEACGRTSGISNPNMNYINKVLINWYNESKGISGKAAGASGAQGIKTGSSIAAEMKKLYTQLTEKNERELRERKTQVYKAIPRIKEIEDLLQKNNYSLTRAALKGDKAEKKKLEEEHDSLIEEKLYTLTENDFSPDYLEMHYACSKCKDSGILDSGERCSCYSEYMKRFV